MSSAAKAEWVERLRSLPQVIESLQPRLRHRQLVAPASAIAAQYYCEVQVELTLARGEVVTPEKDEGKRIHEEIIAMKPAKLDELVERINSGARFGCRFPLLAELEGVPVAGVPDILVFEGGRPAEVVELKTVERIPFSPWRDHLVQAQVYGLLLDCMGFDCSTLKLSILYVRRGWELPPLLSLAHKFENLREQLEEKYPNDLRTFTFGYSRADAEEAVRWALSYWRDERDPVPTRNPSKCAKCVYRGECLYASSRGEFRTRFLA